MLKRLNIALLLTGLLALMLAVAARLAPRSASPASEPPTASAVAPGETPTPAAAAKITPPNLDGDAPVILEMVNQARCDAGLIPLTLHPLLTQAALEHSADMALGGFFDHANPSDGSGPAERITGAGYEWYTIGENIAAGGETAEVTFADWWDSPLHKENILHPDFREMGLGHVYIAGSPFGHYWTQTFGARRDAYGDPPAVICDDPG